GTGGADVGAFTANITVPPDLVCLNCTGTSIDRSKPLTLAWSGGGAQDYVQVVGVSTSVSLADASKNVATVFACTGRASDNTLTVPVSILSQLPSASGDPTANNIGGLAIISGSGNASASFTAPLTAGGNLDVGYFGYTSVLYKLVGY